METLGTLGGETWFRLGDRDLAVHVERTRRLRAGETLSAITADLCRRLGVGPRVLPMSDDPVRTRVRTRRGLDRFPGLLRAPPLRAGGARAGFPRRRRTARAQPDFLAALRDPALQAVVICPSNPFISIEPILAVPGVREALADMRGARRRGVADHRRARGQGADGEDDGGAWHDAECRRRRASLRRPARWLCRRLRRHGPGGRRSAPRSRSGRR